MAACELDPLADPLAWHESRGRAAMDEIGIWPRFWGRGMHDRLASYDAYDCAHSLCGAHLRRDCAGVAEQGEQQQWAAAMEEFLLDLHDAGEEWRQLDLSAVPTIERDDWVARYFEILAMGYAAQAPTSLCRRTIQRPTQAKPSQESAGCHAWASRTSPGCAG